MIINGMKVPEGLLPTGNIQKIELNQQQSDQLKALATSQRGNRLSKERRKLSKPLGKLRPPTFPFYVKPLPRPAAILI